MQVIRLMVHRIASLLAVLIVAGCSGTRERAPGSNIAEANERPFTLKSSAPPRSMPALFIIGDSTVHNAGEGIKGWGDMIDRQFDTNRIVIQNRAKPGRSSRTFQTQGWWEQVLAAARPGDFLLIQFGHNDTSPVNDTNRARGTLPGLGEESTNLINGLTLKPETVHTYGWYLRRYISDARQRGVTPIVCSPVPRLPQPGREQDVTRYVGWARDLAVRESVPFINLNALILERYAGLSAEAIKTNYFGPKDGTHTNPTGAELNAACVVSGIRSQNNCALKDYLREKR